MAMSPLSSATEIGALDDFQETCELSDAIAKKKLHRNAPECGITDDKPSRSYLLPEHQRTAKHVLRVLEDRTPGGAVSPRAVIAKTVVPAPVMINNFKSALEEYLALVNALLPGPYLPQQLQLQPHADSFLEQTYSAEFVKSENTCSVLPVKTGSQFFQAADLTVAARNPFSRGQVYPREGGEGYCEL